jgi:transposase
MHATTVAIDLAKDVFELEVVDGSGWLIRRECLNRTRLGRFVGTLPVCRIVIEACGGVNSRVRRFQTAGRQVVLLTLAVREALIFCATRPTGQTVWRC